MALYTISDPHLAFTCNKPMEIFGAAWYDYTQKLAENWKSKINDGDTVIIPGDISWAMNLNEVLEDLKFINMLPGKKIIGKGNHDYWWETISKLERFKTENGLDTIEFLYNNAFLAENKIICGTRGWLCDEKLPEEDRKILERENVRLRISLEQAIDLKNKFGGEIIPFFHFPPATISATQENIFDTLLEYNIERLYYGHLHNIADESKLVKIKYGIIMDLVSCDYIGFNPIRID